MVKLIDEKPTHLEGIADAWIHFTYGQAILTWQSPRVGTNYEDEEPQKGISHYLIHAHDGGKYRLIGIVTHPITFFILRDLENFKNAGELQFSIRAIDKDGRTNSKHLVAKALPVTILQSPLSVTAFDATHMYALFQEQDGKIHCKKSSDEGVNWSEMGMIAV